MTVSDPLLVAPNTEVCIILAPGESCVLTGTYTVTQADVDAGTIDNTAEVVSDEITTPVEDSVSTPVFFFSRTPLAITKTVQRTDVQIGDLVSYTITVTNTEDLPRLDLDIVDTPPHGFRFVEETSLLDGVATPPEQTGKDLVLDDIDFAANETRTWTLILVVGAGVEDGLHTNQAFVRDVLGNEVSERAEAVVRKTVDPLFDCSELIGKVFDDRNNNGYQDEGELGLGGVRLATATGLLVTTDQHGRYHITCAAVPNDQIGSNFIMKLDKRTLPTGYQVTSENPRVVRLTRGKLSKLNFGAALVNVIELDLTDDAFAPRSIALRPEYEAQLGGLIDALKGQESTLKLTYKTALGDQHGRLDALSEHILELWKQEKGDYKLNIDRVTVTAGASSAQLTGEGE